MTIVTLTSKGQITIPIGIRSVMGLEAGDSVAFVETAKGQFLMTAATPSVQKLKGLITKKGAPVSVDDMNAAIAARGAGLP